jgi:hypothetical protein
MKINGKATLLLVVEGVENLNGKNSAFPRKFYCFNQNFSQSSNDSKQCTTLPSPLYIIDHQFIGDHQNGKSPTDVANCKEMPSKLN